MDLSKMPNRLALQGKEAPETLICWRRTTTGEERWSILKATPILDEQGDVWMAVNIFLDITERKKVEQEIVQLNLELQNANRELEAFSYSVSHDLHAPLRAIMGFSEVLAEEYSAQLDAQGQHYLERIIVNARRGGHLIDDLLALSRLSRAQIEKTRIDMAALARDTFEEMALNAPAHVPELIVKNMPPAFGDIALVREVFANLLANAIKFTSNKEEAYIEVGGREEAESPDIVYYVKDNGAGFDMRFADKLFGVFQRLHSIEEFEGTGVGLAIVQRAIQRQGGRAWAEGKVGEGATFYFTLPQRNG
jgi:light-regulated signal transduction histidine kinase (bacteriophytochrome)